jgi:type I site-specific restriction endonuclease
MTPEQKARVSIDALLVQAGWHVCNVANANIHASTGVAIREFPLNNGFGFADYLLYVNGKACGVIEAKKEGATLTGVELQSGRYAQAMADRVNVNYDVYRIKTEVTEQGAVGAARPRALLPLGNTCIPQVFGVARFCPA